MTPDKKAVFEKNKGWYLGSSASKLRAKVELLSKQQKWSKGPETQESKQEEEVVGKRTAKWRLRRKQTAKEAPTETVARH